VKGISGRWNCTGSEMTDDRMMPEILRKAARRLPRPLKRLFLKATWKMIGLGPQFYDLYYRHFTSVQQGSLGRGYPKPAWRGDARHVLIFTKRYWLLHIALEAAFAKERKFLYNILWLDELWPQNIDAACFPLMCSTRHIVVFSLFATTCWGVENRLRFRDASMVIL
jgi:hypothetical protein